MTARGDCPSDATAIGEHPYLPLDIAESLEERARLLDEGSGRARAFEIALDFVRERYPRCEAAFISGSYAKHAATALSDVDIFVIDARCTTPLREQRVYKGYPGIAEIYKRKVAKLTETLSDPESRLDASSDIRSLVGRIVLHPGEKRGEVHATLHGSLVGILDFVDDNPHPGASRVITSVASGSRG